MNDKVPMLRGEKLIFKADRWDIDGLWQRITPMLQKALEEQTEHTLQSVYKWLQAEKMQLWIVPWDIIVVTEIQRFEGSHVCVLLLCGGQNLEQHKHEFDVIDKWRKSIACDEMKIVGRKGWEKIFPQFENVGTILRVVR